MLVPIGGDAKLSFITDSEGIGDFNIFFLSFYTINKYNLIISANSANNIV